MRIYQTTLDILELTALDELERVQRARGGDEGLVLDERNARAAAAWQRTAAGIVETHPGVDTLVAESGNASKDREAAERTERVGGALGLGSEESEGS